MLCHSLLKLSGGIHYKGMCLTCRTSCKTICNILNQLLSDYPNYCIKSSIEVHAKIDFSYEGVVGLKNPSLKQGLIGMDSMHACTFIRHEKLLHPFIEVVGLLLCAIGPS